MAIFPLLSTIAPSYCANQLPWCEFYEFCQVYGSQQPGGLSLPLPHNNLCLFVCFDLPGKKNKTGCNREPSLKVRQSTNQHTSSGSLWLLVPVMSEYISCLHLLSTAGNNVICIVREVTSIFRLTNICYCFHKLMYFYIMVMQFIFTLKFSISIDLYLTSSRSSSWEHIVIKYIGCCYVQRRAHFI